MSQILWTLGLYLMPVAIVGVVIFQEFRKAREQRQHNSEFMQAYRRRIDSALKSAKNKRYKK